MIHSPECLLWLDPTPSCSTSNTPASSSASNIEQYYPSNMWENSSLPTSIQLVFEHQAAPNGQHAQHANRFNIQLFIGIYTRYVWKHRKMEQNDSSTCLIHGQYTNARMGDANHLAPVVGHKPYRKETERTIKSGYGWRSEVNAPRDPSQTQSKRESHEAFWAEHA